MHRPTSNAEGIAPISNDGVVLAISAPPEGGGVQRNGAVRRRGGLPVSEQDARRYGISLHRVRKRGDGYGGPTEVRREAFERIRR